MLEWALFAGWAPDWNGFRRGSKSLVGVGNIGKCCERFVGVGRRRGLFGCYDCGPFIFACVHVKG